jgi:hypothetical protein
MDKMVKVEKNEKAGKGTAKSPTTIRSKQDLTSPDSKAKVGQGKAGTMLPFISVQAASATVTAISSVCMHALMC